MKKRFAFLCLGVLTILFLTSFVLAASFKKQISECKKECKLNRRTEIKNYNNEYKECRNVYNDEKKTCLNETKFQYAECKETCDELDGMEKRQCKRECSSEKRIQKKTCSKREELLECRTARRECINSLKEEYVSCKNECKHTGILQDETQCTDAGGFFYEICNGPYFDIICSSEKFCLCDGNNNNTCPEGYICNHDIRQLLPRRNTINGYKDFLGNDLGEIGTCLEIVEEQE